MTTSKTQGADKAKFWQFKVNCTAERGGGHLSFLIMFASMRIRSCSVLGRAVTARRSSSPVVRNAFAAEPIQPSIQLSPALRMLKTSLIPLMTPLERSESWEVQQQAFHQRIKREKDLIAERERGTPHWTSLVSGWYHRCLAERPILTKVRMAALDARVAAHAVRFLQHTVLIGRMLVR